MLFEVAFAQKSTVLAHELVDFVRDLAFVKSVLTFLADQSQRLRERQILENVAFRRGATFAIKGVRFQKCAGQTLVETRPKRPIVSDQFCDRKTFLGITNCRGDIVAQLEFAEFFVQLSPRIHRAGHRDRQHAERRNCFAIQLVEFGFHLLIAQAERGASAAI